MVDEDTKATLKETVRLLREDFEDAYNERNAGGSGQDAASSYEHICQSLFGVVKELLEAPPLVGSVNADTVVVVEGSIAKLEM